MIGLDTAGFEAPFRLPRHFTPQTLITTGRLFVESARPAQDRFVAYGMPEDFVARLETLVKEFDGAVNTLESGLDTHTKASVSIRTALAQGAEAVKRLHVIVLNRFQHDQATLAVWGRDRKVDYARRVRRVSAKSLPIDTLPSADEKKEVA